jgi:hypothetical protein
MATGNRIFISYRSSDGKKDADRLCADLSRIFGEDQVFFDKQDLRGGLSWRGAIDTALGARPVVLLLVTPELVAAPTATGERRIDQDDDPIRNELLIAQARRAVIIPLLTEGMPMPGAASLPEPLRFLTEAHALKLRTEDWSSDLARLVADLESQGIKPVQPVPPKRSTTTAPPAAKRRWPWVVGLCGVAWLALLNLDPGEPDGPEIAPPTHSAATPQPVAATTVAPTAPTSANLSGAWWSIDLQNRRTGVSLRVSEREAELRSEPIPVDWYPEWKDFAQRLQSSQGVVVNHLVYVARGERFLNQLDLRFEVFSAEGVGPLDTGSFNLKVSPDGHEIRGELWSNGDQGSVPVHLVRAP